MRVRTIALVAALLALAATAWGEPPRHDFPRVGQYEVLSGDFHMHTVMSDGRITTKERVKEAYDLGYDVIAITDHGRPVTYHVAKPYGESLGMVILRGFETGIDKNEHMVILGAQGFYRPRDSHRWAEKPGEKRAYYQDELAAILKDGGFAVLAHPKPQLREQTQWAIAHGALLGVEVANGRSRYEHSFNWALERNLTFFADSDIHATRKQHASVTLVLVREHSEKGVLDALRERRTAAWFPDAVWGREKLLADLISASVSATRAADGSVALENRCPIDFKGTLGSTTFDLGAYQKATLAAGDAKSVTIQWDNVWTGPKTNLITTLTIR